ncbi:MAG: 30S ribosomal protein S17 [Sulfolobaceae archaeon]|jgi:small subunit ribosomal protein S17|uniref:30S ribosomal protein S17 n=1 Tax=unclassified Stygiolobus TaxID=2824672 RepID=UPI000D5799DE|nr:30S ribosomal protein S17 [Sulfolobaceae archaeon]PVU75120.1 30S ribosomal protein S17 [Sulfolobus sp. SCGC AB-777_G06]
MGKKGQLIKSVGIEGVEAPSKACDDQNCPFHGSLRVRGLILDGILIKFKAMRTGVVEREYLYFNTKYKRYERRRSRIHVHIPPCLDVKEGDKVIIGETRPIAKSVSFVVLGKSR